MKIYAALAAFATLNQFNGYVLTRNLSKEKEVPTFQLFEHSADSLGTIKLGICRILGVSPNWNGLLYKNCGIVCSENAEYIVYSILLPQIQMISKDFESNTEWTKIQEINTLSQLSQNIIYQAIKQRF